MKHGFVYIWRDKKHNRYYIGAHWGTVDDGYICSSNWMRDAYRKRPKDFKRRILKSNIDRSLLMKEEQKWLDMIKKNEIRTRYYNLFLHGSQIWQYNEEKRKTIAEKISILMKGVPKSPEHREKLRQIGLKRKHSEETKAKMS